MTTTWITICDTCKREGWETGAMAQTDGEILAALVEQAAEGLEDVRVREDADQFVVPHHRQALHRLWRIPAYFDLVFSRRGVCTERDLLHLGLW